MTITEINAMAAAYYAAAVAASGKECPAYESLPSAERHRWQRMTARQLDTTTRNEEPS